MIILRQVIHYPDTNSVEATWVESTETTSTIPDPEWSAPMIEDEFGNSLPDPDAVAPLIPHVTTSEVQVKCHSYADCQMDMFRADVAELGGDLSEHEEMIALVLSDLRPPTPEPIPDYEALRYQAYLTEADPLFFKAQRGEATHAEWLAKVAEIKARFTPDIVEV